VAAARAAGKRVLFVTNNATKSRAVHAAKLARVAGVPDASPSDVVSSAYAAALAVAAAGVTRAYVVGGQGVIDELAAVGCSAEGPEDWGREFEFGATRPADVVDPAVGAVVIGFDPRFCYYKLMRAATYLRYGKGVLFVATNRDAAYPDAHMLTPGGGALVAALETGAGRPPDVVAGKPSASLLDIVTRATGLDRARTAMIGDRLDTDILWGNQGGLASTLLVGTGVTSDAARDALARDDPARPTHAVDSLGSIAAWLEK
jgi:phosphoglycolate/pyridoxal phosphate phosphatase family enzyme